MGIKSAQAYPGQRSKEKNALWRLAGPLPLAKAAKRKFFSLFDNACFKCGIKEKETQVIGQFPILCVDHHVPMSFGGHLQPGNLVALCRRCNEKKLDKDPETFYSSQELQRLQPILASQTDFIKSILFDPDRWMTDRVSYLIDFGYSLEEVNEMLTDETHPYHEDVRISTLHRNTSIEIGVSLEAFSERSSGAVSK
jgi:hypothetical protein